MPDALQLVSRPSAGDAGVLAARGTLEASLGLRGVAGRLQTVSSRLSRARAACAPFPQLRAQLADSLARIARATEGAHAAAASFRGVCAAALDDLDDARDLLGDGLGAAAAATLRASSARARTLGPAARRVALDFEQCAGLVSDALTVARAQQTAQAAKREHAAAEMAAASAALSEARDRHSLAATAVDDAHRLFVEAEGREKAASNRANMIHTAQLAVVVGAAATTRSPRLAFLSATGVGAISAQIEARMLRAREEKAVFLSQKMRARERQFDVAQHIEGLAAQVRCVREVADVDPRDVAALEAVVDELRALAGAMLAVESFWVRLKAFADAGDGTPVDQVVQKGLELTPADQVALWESPRFCKRLADAYAHWMALWAACEDCLRGLDEARNALYEDFGASDEQRARSDAHLDEVVDLVNVDEDNVSVQSVAGEKSIDLAKSSAP